MNIYENVSFLGFVRNQSSLSTTMSLDLSASAKNLSQSVDQLAASKVEFAEPVSESTSGVVTNSSMPPLGSLDQES